MVLRGNIIILGWKVKVRVWYESRAVMILLDLAANKKKPDPTDKSTALRSRDEQKKI